MSENIINHQSKIINRKSKIVNRKFFWPAFIAVTLIAAFFRFYHLADHPLGLFFDPAINGLDAIRLMERGGPVVFFPTNGGREALLIYLLIPFIWLFGANPFSFRLQLAIISLLNVVFLFGFIYDLRFTTCAPMRGIYDLRPPHRGPLALPVGILEIKGSRSQSPISNPTSLRSGDYSLQSLWLAALTSLVLAVSAWHIGVSRLDQRPLSVPMLAVPVFWFFLKGWYSGRTRWFILSGLCLGLAFHTYSAARLIPLILVLSLLFELILNVQTLNVKRLTFNVLAFTLATLLVAAPLIWYFLSHPAQFSARAASVMVWHYLTTPADALAELGRNLLRVLGFFCCAGSPNAIFGLPGMPGLPLLLTPFLVIGLLVTLVNWRSLLARLTALWWLVGIIPSLIAIEAPHPLRLIVALPPTAILVALGLVQFSIWLQARLTFNVPPAVIFFALPLALILATVPATFLAYFSQWPQLPVTQGIYDYGAVAIRQAVLAHSDEDGPIYLPLARFNAQPLLFYLSDTFQRQAALTATPAERALVIAPQKNATDAVWVRLYQQQATILPPLTAEGQQLIQSALAGESTQPIRTRRGEEVARLAPLPTDPAQFLLLPTQTLTAAFGPARLIGATYPANIDPTAGQLPVTLYWQADESMSHEFEVLLQLVDDQRRVWGDGTARPNDWVYPTTFWRPGIDTVAAQQIITFEPDTLPPGRYWLAVSLYDSFAGERLPLAAPGHDSPDTLFIGPLKVPLFSPPLSAEQPGRGVATFGEIIKLADYEVPTSQIAAGQPVQINLFWQALKTPLQDYTVFIHLLDAQNNLVAGNDTQPVNNSYPTAIWSPGEQIFDPHTLSIPADLPSGPYRLAVGLYHQPTGQRLPLRWPDGRLDETGQFILPAPVTVINNP